ncbi:MAG: hypothetical protein GC159_08795 [Phycisphaera sp.]|nr:hypothetical protein [Phycisphaera sp.]
MKQYYLNTDLVITGGRELVTLASVFDAHCDLLYCDARADATWQITAEADGSGRLDDPTSCPERDIASLLHVIESLASDKRAVLEACERIEFNIGWQSAEVRPEGCFDLTPELLQRIALAGAVLVVTIYPSSENESDELEHLARSCCTCDDTASTRRSRHAYSGSDPSEDARSDRTR